MKKQVTIRSDDHIEREIQIRSTPFANGDRRSSAGKTSVIRRVLKQYFEMLESGRALLLSQFTPDEITMMVEALRPDPGEEISPLGIEQKLRARANGDISRLIIQINRADRLALYALADMAQFQSHPGPPTVAHQP